MYVMKLNFEGDLIVGKADLIVGKAKKLGALGFKKHRSGQFKTILRNCSR